MRKVKAVALLAAVVLLVAAACSSGGGGGGGKRSNPGGGGSGSGTGTGSGGGSGGPGGGAGGAGSCPVHFAQLDADIQARRQAYLANAANVPAGVPESIHEQIARLETGIGPISRPALEFTLDFMASRQDTADFGANLLIRLVYLHGQNTMIPLDLRQRAESELLGFKYWVDEPGQDGLVFWSENHQILFATCEYLAGHLYPGQVFPNAGLTGADHAAKGRLRVLRWLDHRLRFGFSEWYSPVYYEEDLAPLFNLVDFAPDVDVRTRAAMVLDLMVFDLARLTNRGSFGVTSGRCYEEHKWSGRSQSVGDLIEVLFGTRGGFRRPGSASMGGISFATSRSYRVPHALLAIGRDAPARLLDRSRIGISFTDGPAEGIGFQSFEDGMFWWGMGAYVAPETIVLSRSMIEAWDLWHYSYFSMLGPLRSFPDFLLPGLSSTLSPLSEGSVLSTASTVTFRTPDAMLSSVQSWRRGQVGYQQHAWQATLDLDAVVFTTAPGLAGRDGPGDWTGSGSLPRVVQVDDVAAILYNPPFAVKAVFPSLTHAFFPKAAFDEVVTQGSWTFGRKGEGYVALYSAQPTRWQGAGAFADRELMADGDRNVWICQVGRQAEDGAFADFMARIAAASVVTVGTGNAPQSDPLSVRYEAPGVGTIEVAWSGAPTLGGAPIAIGGFPRFDNPDSQTPWGARRIRIAHGGAALDLDLDLGTRAGDGL